MAALLLVKNSDHVLALCVLRLLLYKHCLTGDLQLHKCLWLLLCGNFCLWLLSLLSFFLDEPCWGLLGLGFGVRLDIKLLTVVEGEALQLKLRFGQDPVTLSRVQICVWHEAHELILCLHLVIGLTWRVQLCRLFFPLSFGFGVLKDFLGVDN